MTTLTQEQISLIVKCLVFTASTDACLSNPLDISDVKDLLYKLHEDCPAQMSHHLNVAGIYIFGDEEAQEDLEMNKMLHQWVPHLRNEEKK